MKAFLLLPLLDLQPLSINGDLHPRWWQVDWRQAQAQQWMRVG
jgi:hypothetical protein